MAEGRVRGVSGGHDVKTPVVIRCYVGSPQPEAPLTRLSGTLSPACALLHGSRGSMRGRGEGSLPPSDRLVSVTKRHFRANHRLCILERFQVRCIPGAMRFAHVLGQFSPLPNGIFPPKPRCKVRSNPRSVVGEAISRIFTFAVNKRVFSNALHLRLEPRSSLRSPLGFAGYHLYLARISGFTIFSAGHSPRLSETIASAAEAAMSSRDFTSTPAACGVITTFSALNSG